ncbi:MAG: hypothetical protein A4E66_02727 [Syntrophus sp. PtaB.Bin001]|nr:MAG: hypothetical protein A4E66_02727 [Syntrophus sp. PtaB.Bin001]
MKNGLRLPARNGKVEGNHPCAGEKFPRKFLSQTTHDIRKEVAGNDIGLPQIDPPEIPIKYFNAFFPECQEFGLQKG